MKTKIKIIVGIIILALSIFVIKEIFFSQVKENPKIIENSSTQKVYQSPISDLQKEYENQDIIAQLEIPSINIKEPIAKANDNDYYLTHDLHKNENKIGATFIDYRTSDINKAKQINIYGHNSVSYTVPFKELENYEDKDFFYSNPDIIFKTDKQEFNYRIFVSKIIDNSNDEHMIISYNGEKFLEHVKLLRNNALYDTKEEITEDDDILIIQTCLFHPDNRKLLLIAKKVTN